MMLFDVVMYNPSTDCSTIPESERVDCGWAGITQQQCETNLCCFDSSLAGVPDCFYRASKLFHQLLEFFFHN